MLRESIKHGISEALSAHPGFEVWDFDLRQSRREGEVKLEIRYRYHDEFVFRACLKARAGEVMALEVVGDAVGHTYAIAEDDGLDINLAAVPGRVEAEDAGEVATLEEFYDAIAAWTVRLDEELAAATANRVRLAQQKALGELGRSVAGLPEGRMDAPRVSRVRERLDALERTVLELRAGVGVEDADERALEIREEFASLRQRAAILGERHFFQSVLVRLVKYFWDDANLRLVEAAGKAAAGLLEDRGIDVPAATAPRAEIAQHV